MLPPWILKTSGRRTLRDVLAHRSGLPAWIPFYLDLMAHQDSVGGQHERQIRVDGLDSAV